VWRANNDAARRLASSFGHCLGTSEPPSSSRTTTISCSPNVGLTFSESWRPSQLLKLSHRR